MLPHQSNIMVLGNLKMRKSVRSQKRIALCAILAGLLFSPAEGIYLLPFPASLFGQTRGVSLNNAYGYQKSVRRIERDQEKPDSTSQSIGNSPSTAIGISPIHPHLPTLGNSALATSNLFDEVLARIQPFPKTLYSRPPPSH